MSPTYLGQSATPENAQLDALPQLSGLLGGLPASVVAAMRQFAITPAVASAAARDLIYPAPQLNDRVLRTDKGIYERFGTPASGANTWLPDGLTRSAGPVISSNALGVVGDGLADDTPFLAAADVGAVASGGRHELDLGVLPNKCFINSNLTLSAHFRPNPGGGKLISVAAGKTLTIAGPFDPSIAAVFDHTMLGTVVWASTSIEHYYAKWFNVKGDGVTDDSAAITWYRKIVPDGSRVCYTMGMRTVLRHPSVETCRTAIHEYSQVPAYAASVGGLGAAEFIWDGDYGHRMFVFDRCQHPVMEGFVYRPNSGGGFGFGGSITAGQKTLVDSAAWSWYGGFGVVAAVGRRVRVSNAGPLDSEGNPTDLITTIDSVDFIVVPGLNGGNAIPAQLTLHDAASTTASVVFWEVGTAQGLSALALLDFKGQPGIYGEEFVATGGAMTAGKDVLRVDLAVWDYRVFFPDMVGQTVTIAGAGGQGSDGVMTAGFADLTTTIGIFTPQHVGQQITVFNTGPGFANLITTIQAYVSPTHVVLAVAAGSSQAATVYKIDFVSTILKVYDQQRAQMAIAAPVTFAGKQFTIQGVANGNSLGTNGVVKDGYITMSRPVPNANFIRISVSAQENHEFYTIRQVKINGNFDIDQPTTATTTLGAPTTITNIPILSPRHLGLQIAIENAGPGGNTAYKGKIIAIVGTTATVDTPISTAVAGGYTMIGTGFGTGIVVGLSPNSLGHYFEDIDGSQLFRIIDNGGSFTSRRVEAAGLSIDAPYYFQGTSRPCVLINDVFEGTGCWVEHAPGAAINGPITIIGGQCAVGNLRPNKSAFSKIVGNVILQGTGMDNALAPARTWLDSSQLTGKFLSTGHRFAPGTTMATSGYAAALARTSGLFYSMFDEALTDAPAYVMSNRVIDASGFDLIGALVGESRTAGTSLERHVGVLGRGIIGNSGNVSDKLTGVRGTVGSDAGGSFNRSVYMVEALMPVLNTNGFGAPECVGLHVTSPNLSGGGASQMTGLKIEDQQANPAGISATGTKGVQQLGPNDQNILTALTTFGAGKVEKATVYIDIGAGGNAAPNPAGAEDYRYRIAGAATINVPLNPLDGMTFTMEIFNNTAGAITPTLNGIFAGTGYGSIGAGKSRTRRWVYDGNTTKWKPVGAVSEDF